MKKWLKKRVADKKAQRAYWEEHRYCEVCIAEGKRKVAEVEIHEIIYKSGGGKCISENMIAVCLNDHKRCHYLRGPCLEKEDLWEIKGLDIEEMEGKLRGIRRGETTCIR